MLGILTRVSVEAIGFVIWSSISFQALIAEFSSAAFENLESLLRSLYLQELGTLEQFSPFRVVLKAT